MKLAKLDSYDYFILPSVIQIMVDGNTDPALVDILSEVERANGNIFCEGRYFLMAGYEIHHSNELTYLDLKVTELDRETA